MVDYPASYGSLQEGLEPPDLKPFTNLANGRSHCETGFLVDWWSLFPSFLCEKNMQNLSNTLNTLDQERSLFNHIRDKTHTKNIKKSLKPPPPSYLVLILLISTVQSLQPPIWSWRGQTSHFDICHTYINDTNPNYICTMMHYERWEDVQHMQAHENEIRNPSKK